MTKHECVIADWKGKRIYQSNRKAAYREFVNQVDAFNQNNIRNPHPGEWHEANFCCDCGKKLREIK